MDIFDLKLEDFEQAIRILISKYTPEELLNELKTCGYEVSKKWYAHTYKIAIWMCKEML